MGCRLSQPLWSVADWPCQVAGTPLLGAVDSQLLFLPAGSRSRVDGLEGIVGVLDRQARDEPVKDSRSPCRRFGYCLVTRAGEPTPKVVRSPLRSDLTVPACTISCNLNVGSGN